MLRLTQPQRARLPRLLHMEYTLRELARELKCSPAQLKRALDDDCPHRLDNRARVWIIGDKFYRWYETAAVQLKTKLKDGEAYCLRCRRAVEFEVEGMTEGKHGVVIQRGTCPVCQAIVNRIRRAL